MVAGLMLGMLSLALALLAPATGGVTAVIAADLSLHQASAHMQDYVLEHAMAGTDFDQAHALCAEDPSLFWLALDIVGVLIDVGEAAGAVATTVRAGGRAQQVFDQLSPLVHDVEAADTAQNLTKSLDRLDAAARTSVDEATASRIRESARRSRTALGNEPRAILQRLDSEAISVATAEEGLNESLGSGPFADWLNRQGVTVELQEQLIEIQVRQPDGTLRTEEAFALFDGNRIILSRNVGRYEGFFSAGGGFVDEGASTARSAFGRIAQHEFAHAVHARTSALNQIKITEAWNRARSNRRFISSYACRNEEEWFAETFEAYLAEREELESIDAEAARLMRAIIRDEALE